MATKMCLLFLLLETLRAVATGNMLQGVGCEEGWLSHSHFCYYFGLKEGNYQDATQSCEDLGASLASIWTREERTFVTDVLWQPSVGAHQFAWFGLHGTQNNDWAYEDYSVVIMDDGVLTSSSGQPASKSTKCGAFTGTGSLAFLQCNDTSTRGFICKKALPRVFATSDLLNHTIPVDSLVSTRGAQLFERVWPPLLIHFPKPDLYLATAVNTDSETGCAFRCYNVHDCKAFQVTCISEDMCKTVTCTLLKHLNI